MDQIIAHYWQLFSVQACAKQDVLNCYIKLQNYSLINQH